jgi:hypothetical protein
MNTNLPPLWVCITSWVLATGLVWGMFFGIAYLLNPDAWSGSLLITGGMTVFASAVALTFNGDDDYMEMP